MAKNLELSYLIDFYGDVLTDKQRDVMEQYYNDDLSLSEIAENFGITRQGVRDSIKRAEGILLELESKVGFAQRYRAMQEGLGQLQEIATELDFRNKNGFVSAEDLEKCTAAMLGLIRDLSD